RQRVATRKDPAPDEEVEITVPVVVGQGQGPNARAVSRGERGHRSRCEGVSDDTGGAEGLRGRCKLVARDPCEHLRRAAAIRRWPAENCGQVSRRWWDAHRDCPETVPVVSEPYQRAGATGAHEEVFPVIAVDVIPGDAGPQLTEGIGQQRL